MDFGDDVDSGEVHAGFVRTVGEEVVEDDGESV